MAGLNTMTFKTSRTIVAKYSLTNSALDLTKHKSKANPLLNRPRALAISARTIASLANCFSSNILSGLDRAATTGLFLAKASLNSVSQISISRSFEFL